MQIMIKGIQLELTPSLKEYIEEKLGGLVKYIKKFDAEAQPEMSVEVLRNTRHHHKGEVFQANVNLNLPNRNLKASAEAEDIRAAIDRVKDELRAALEKYKTQLENKTKARE